MVKRHAWILIALLALMIGAPNATILRVIVQQADPYYISFCRFALIGLVCLPFIIRARKQLFAKPAFREVLLVGLFLSICIPCYNFALLYSQASYVTIVSLLSPIVLILLSVKFFHDTINRRIAAGVTLAMIGAMVLVLLPVAFTQNGTTFYPIATVLAVINFVFYGLVFIYMRRANERGVPMPAVIGMSALIVAASSLVLFAVVGNHQAVPHDGLFFVAVIYSGVVVALIGRAMNIKAYEHIGASIMSAIAYFEMFVAILIPVIVLHERLSPTTVAGGIIILIGVYIVEYHGPAHSKHRVAMRHH